MTHSLDEMAARADDEEVGRLVDELVSEIGATPLRPEIKELAAELQAMLDEKEQTADARILR